MERGINPDTLLQLVRNTAPWIERDRGPLTPYHRVILYACERPDLARLSHYDYFELCLSAHYSTVATFVPTDVDNQIRKHLWLEVPLETTQRMAALVLDSLAWDFRPVTARYQEGEGRYVCGHQGEWFSVAVGAYAAHRESAPALAAEVLHQISAEVKAEAELFAGLRKARDGIGLLKASTAIAHNLGDLDRVIDQWELPESDALRAAVYKLGHAAAASGWKAELVLAGNLNKAYMASENHRHYPLRQPKGLRASLDLLLPLGPFFDAWGERVGLSVFLEARDRLEVAEALLEGFQKLSSPKVPLYGYARALSGLLRSARGLEEELSSKNRKLLEKGLLADLVREDQREFEALWGRRALGFLKL